MSNDSDNADKKVGNVEKEKSTRPEDRGLAERDRDYRRVYAKTRDHRAAVRAYCAGNQWATENAKAVGNW